jgi:hypothetical protein
MLMINYAAVFGGAAMLATVSFVAAVSAQQPLQAPPQQQAALCQAFRKNDAGQWCPITRATFSTPGGVVTLSPGVCFKAGTPINGRDIGAELDQQCR